jgi:hypothetical protein
MAVVCASVAMGPGRVLAWVVADTSGRDVQRATEDAAADGQGTAGWIEEL